MNTGHLIVAQDLVSILDADDLVVVDCRFDLADPGAGRRNYEAGHIPGAVYADLDRDLAAPVGPATGRHPLPVAGKLAATLGGLGIGNRNRVVVYDGANGGIAARCWWLLRWLGHDDVQLLDGGFAAWIRAGYRTVPGAETLPTATFNATPRDDLVVSTEDLARLLDSGVPLVDARDGARFRGEVEPIDDVAGHIPGALNLPFTAFVDDAGCWRDRESRQALWLDFFDRPVPETWAVMCGSGVTACHLVISALEAGIPEPRVYVGSWSEWIRDGSRPVAAGDA